MKIGLQKGAGGVTWPTGLGGGDKQKVGGGRANVGEHPRVGGSRGKKTKPGRVQLGERRHNWIRNDWITLLNSVQITGYRAQRPTLCRDGTDCEETSAICTWGGGEKGAS